MVLSKRVELQQMYERGWDAWDADLLKASLTEDFFFDDPALPERVSPRERTRWPAPQLVAL